MFDMGLWEVVLIFVVMLVIVGPERLPRLARTAGLWIGKARTMVASVKAEVEQELKVDELKRSITQQADVEEFKRLADQVKSINSDVQAINSDVRSTLAESPKATSEPETESSFSPSETGPSLAKHAGESPSSSNSVK